MYAATHGDMGEGDKSEMKSLERGEQAFIAPRYVVLFVLDEVALLRGKGILIVAVTRAHQKVASLLQCMSQTVINHV